MFREHMSPPGLNTDPYLQWRPVWISDWGQMAMVDWYARPEARQWRCDAAPDEPEVFHRRLPDYARTPLLDAPDLADEFSVGRVAIKDESVRFGLPAFKMLGASWAVYRAIADHDPSRRDETPDDLAGLRNRSVGITLVAATDGNHGRAVAHMAGLIGASVRIFVPRVVGAAAIRLIEAEGAEVVVVDEPYDSVVRRAAASAAENADDILMQDTSWSGYEQIPQWIVDGYSTLFREIDTQLDERAAEPAGLVVVPTGVGSLTQAAVVNYRSGDASAASLLSVEPDSAACVLISLDRKEPVSVDTGATNMSGLNCGTPSALAWPYLRNGVDAAISVSDVQAERGSSDLEASGASSGPCGGATLAGLRQALAGEDAPNRRRQLRLTRSSTVVLLNTEGHRPGD